jgi:hypothetical protein
MDLYRSAQLNYRAHKYQWQQNSIGMALSLQSVQAAPLGQIE